MDTIISTDPSINVETLYHKAGARVFIGISGLVQGEVDAALKEVDLGLPEAIFTSDAYLEICGLRSNVRHRFELAQALEEEYDEVDDILGPVESCASVDDTGDTLTCGDEFCIAIPLPPEVDTEEITIKYSECGVLEVTLPFLPSYLEELEKEEAVAQERQKDCSPLGGETLRKYDIE